MRKNNQNKKLSLYIHIPFCVQKCHYCDFLSFVSTEDLREKYVQVLLKEIESYKDSEYAQREILSVFIGGGTPTVLDGKQTERICDKIKSIFNKKDCEFSMEMNPGTATKEKCRIYRECGINRVSIGLQSVHDNQLKLLGRIHNYEQFLQSYHMLRNAGIKNINVDLMAALPGQSTESYCEGLEKVLELKPEHISAYSLIIEEGTPFYEKYYNRCDLLPDEETDRLMYARTKEILRRFGYNRYEISNYALPGYECIHNQVYWQQGEYLGLGLGSSSYVNHSRFHNTECMEEYLGNCQSSNSQNGGLPASLHKEKHVLSTEEEMEEFMFLGLRRMEGISPGEFERRFGVDINQVYGRVIEKYLDSGHLMCYEKKNARSQQKIKYLSLTDKGIDVSNRIFEDFLLL